MRARRGPLKTMRRALVALACVLLVGCTSSAASSSGTAAGGTAVKTNQVDLPPSYLFSPTRIQVSPGSTVTWTNHDNFTHSVQVQGQADVHMMKPGETAQITFSTPGEYSYLCTLHAQNMRATVVVG